MPEQPASEQSSRLEQPFTPEILAPAGDRPAFYAALAAGADAIYMGLKHFSARMQAENASVKELALLAELARSKGAKVYLPFNTLLKPGDLDAAGRLLYRVARLKAADAIIFQDPAVPALARQAGFDGQLHLSTLGNMSCAAGLAAAKALGVSRVILPRELSIDEIRALDQACPEDLDLELFIHGALCYCVSGRCYWSSYLGGKSGLRGRCVQPCRRTYAMGRQKARFFSCQDLSLDVLAKTLLDIPRLRCWKIEGRKKGPHYVYYTVSAYKLIRDNPSDGQARKQAAELLERALGRKGGHYNFLPQRPQSPVGPQMETGSGLFLGTLSKDEKRRVFLRPREPLLAHDLIRVGYEDEPGHMVMGLKSAVPKGGRLDIRGKGKPPRDGAAVFLIDRREPELHRLITGLENEFKRLPQPADADANQFAPTLPRPLAKREKPWRMTVRRRLPQGPMPRGEGAAGLWLSQGSAQGLSKTLYDRIWWWLPPVIWPNEEEQVASLVQRLVRGGARQFVCNAPWQAAFFEEPAKLDLTAGPFCNLANALSVQAVADLGFRRAMVSPELGREELLALPGQSPLPLGLVLGGFWPYGLSRVKPLGVKPSEALESPMKEQHFCLYYGQNAWLYPAWELDLGGHRAELEAAGYSLFVNLHERRPRSVADPGRTSEFNWDGRLL